MTTAHRRDERRLILAGMAALALAMGIGRFAFTPLLPPMRAEGLEVEDGLAWGECQGSGANPYRAVFDQGDLEVSVVMGAHQIVAHKRLVEIGRNLSDEQTVAIVLWRLILPGEI